MDNNCHVDLESITDVAVAAASRGGEILRRQWGQHQVTRKKGAIDLVTETDVASEKAITEVIQSAFPEHSIQAEEGGDTPRIASHKWIVDPLDGTTNYAHGLPEFCLSIAFAYQGKPVVGLVLNPITEELFCGIEGKGATLNGKPLRVSNVENLKDALLVTGFPYQLEPVVDPLMNRFRRCLLAAQGVRRLGSAALDLCYVACGRFDGFWEQNLAPWDTAAGWVVAEQAGASVSDFSNQPYLIDKKEILATNGLIHEKMVILLREQ